MKTKGREFMTLGIYGSGGLGREVLDIVRTPGSKPQTWDETVFISDFASERLINGAKVFTFAEFCAKYPQDEANVVIAVGEPEVRAELAKTVTDKGYKLSAIMHPGAFISAEAQIGDGAIICFGCFISCNSKIGLNALIQPNACVGHDSIIGDCSVISTFVSIAGRVTVGEKTYIGMSVPVKEGASIGNQSIVGMGSAVIRDIPDEVVALGNPARTMKPNEKKRVFS